MPNPPVGVAADAPSVEAQPLDTPAEDVPQAVDAAEVADEVAFVVKESKAGYKTTEFWITLITSIAVVLNAVPAPESKEGYIVAGLAALYAISRGLAKNHIPNTETEVKV